MELLKPIFVKRWVAENNYIEYVFDNNPNNNYKNAIVLKDYIFRDINIKETLDKIAYHIFNYENKNSGDILYPYYFWSSINNVEKSLLFNPLKLVSSKNVYKNVKNNSNNIEVKKEEVERKKLVKRVQYVSESETQYLKSKKLIQQYPDAKLLGKTKNKNLVFQVNESKIKITPKGDVI